MDNIIVRFEKVLIVDDDQAGLRIKVRLDPEDCNVTNDDDLPYCFPLLPKHVHLNPKVGECVMVILTSMGNAYGNRLFIGPVVSQPYGLYQSPYDYDARSLIRSGNIAKPWPNPDMNADNDGTLPDREDVALLGRTDCDVILKDRELRLRCGFKKLPYSTDCNSALNFNREDLAYIQMKYKATNDSEGNRFSSVINVVADRINLLSHDSVTSFKLNDSKELITEDELRNIIDKAHPAVFGDNLVDLLAKMISVIRTHTHPFSMDPPALSQTQSDYLTLDRDELLSQSVRLN